MAAPNKVALFWLTTAVGAVLFVTFQLFFYVNEFVRALGATPGVTFERGVLWMFSAFYGSWIVTVLLALIGSRKAQWVSLVLGSLLVVLNTLGGLSDGLRDGWHVAFSALFFIALPGAFAIAANWRRIKRKETTMSMNSSEFPLVWMNLAPEPAHDHQKDFDEFEANLQRGERFVLLTDAAPAEDHEHSPEEKKRTALWIKKHKLAMRSLVLAMILVEPNAAKRLGLKAFAVLFAKFWGYPLLLASSREEATEMARGLLASGGSSSH